MPTYKFQLISDRGEGLHHTLWDPLFETVNQRIPLADAVYEGHIDDDELTGRPLPDIETIALEIAESVSREEARVHLQEAVVGLGRTDIRVVHA